MLYVYERFKKNLEQYSGKCVGTKPRQIKLQRQMKKFGVDRDTFKPNFKKKYKVDREGIWIE